jgi:hypothetical protein
MVSFEDIKLALSHYEIVLRPDKDEDGWWAGAPSVARNADGTFFLAARMRNAIDPRGRRGYEIRLFESSDGHEFSKISSITREDVGLPGFERSSLLYDAASRKFKLYGCGEFVDGWGIWKLDDVEQPVDFDASTIHVVLGPMKPDIEESGAQEHHATFNIQYKDPFIISIGNAWHMFVIGFDRIERPYHFASADGETWRLATEKPILPNIGWHDFYTRPACLIPLDVGYLLVYEGSDVSCFDPGYNIATGLAYSLDLDEFHDLTTQSPILESTTPGKYRTWRYSHWIKVDSKIFVYFEAACPDGTNELRLSTIEL